MEAQAMVGTLIFGFAAILATHLLVTGRWCTGQTAFTGIWLLSAVTLMGYPQSWPYLTWGGVALMVGAHAAFMVGSLTMASRRRPIAVAPAKSLRTAVVWTYWSTLGVSILGIAGLVVATGAWQLALGASAAALRYVELDPSTIPTLPRIISNFMLVPVALAPAMATATGSSRPRFRYYVLPFLCLLGQSAAFGGRGAVTFGGLLIVWGFASALTVGFFTRIDRRTLTILGGFFALFLVYSQGIFSSRQDFGDTSGFGDYIALPIPAGCQVLAENTDQPALNFDFGNLAPIREGLRSSGVAQDKRIDDIVVMIPDRYNVFTYLFEQIQAFGYVGLLLVAFAIGAASSALEAARQTVVVLGIRSLVYCYLGMTLFADLAFFYSGWSLALVIVGFGVPTLARTLAPVRRPEAARP